MFADIRSAARGLLRAPTVAVSGVLCLALGSAPRPPSPAPSAARSSSRFPSATRNARRRPPDDARIPDRSAPGRSRRRPTAISLSARAGSRDSRRSPSARPSSPCRARPCRRARSTSRATSSATLGARAALGRLLAPDDDHVGQAPVAVLSEEFWRSRLGGDPSIVGKTWASTASRRRSSVSRPPDFHVPHGFNVIRADIWTPIRFTPRRWPAAQQLPQSVRAPGERRDAGVRAVGAPHVLRGDRRRESGADRGEDVRVAPLQAENVGAVRKPLLLLLGAVGMVLLISATNVAAMLLARGVQRRREMAVRTALGASRWGTMRPALMESLLITAVGVVLGLGVAVAGCERSARSPGRSFLSWRG